MSIASNAPVRHILHYPPEGHQPKPLITIKTTTFVELLGRAREWDSKFPALAGASRAYLLEQFTFNDQFCAYATQAELRRSTIEEVIFGRRYTRCSRWLKTLIVAVALVTGSLFFLPADGRAQGDDFPGPGGGFPTYPPGGTTNFPVNGGQWQWGGIKWGPVQITAFKGDTIVFDVVGNCRSCYWRFAIMYSSPMISAGTDMQLEDPYTDGPKWHHFLDNGQDVTFCNGRCRFSVKAGEDYPWLWLAFEGNSDWYNQIEIAYVIPAPPPPQRPLFKMFTDPDKDQAQGISTGLGAMAGLWFGTGAILGAYDYRIGAIFGALGWGAQIMAGRFHDIARDPPDYNYCEPTPMFYIDEQVHNDVDWLRQPDYDFAYGWLPASLEQIVSLGNHSQVAIDRAMTAAEDGNMDCANARRAEALQGLWYVGEYIKYFEWAITVTADAFAPWYDMSYIYSQREELERAAYFLQGLQ